MEEKDLKNIQKEVHPIAEDEKDIKKHLEKEDLKKEELKAKEETKVEKKEEKKEKKLKEEIKKLEAENAKLKNDYARAYADTENMKKRLQSEADSAKKYRIQSFALEILPALDNLGRALQASDEDSNAYRKGVKMIYDQLISALEKEGVCEIDCLDKPFDPNFQQAIMTEKVEGKEPGIVLEVLQKGYMLKDRILRAAIVKVSE